MWIMMRRRMIITGVSIYHRFKPHGGPVMVFATEEALSWLEGSDSEKRSENGKEKEREGEKRGFY